jgi:hypothetical protein
MVGVMRHAVALPGTLRKKQCSCPPRAGWTFGTEAQFQTLMACPQIEEQTGREPNEAKPR